MSNQDIYHHLFKNLSDDKLYSPSALVRHAKSSESWNEYTSLENLEEAYVEKKLADVLRKRMKRSFSTEQIVEFISPVTKRKTTGVLGKRWKEEFGIEAQGPAASTSLNEEALQYLENLQNKVETLLSERDAKQAEDDSTIRIQAPGEGRFLKIFELSDDLTLDSLVASNKIWKAKYESLAHETQELRLSQQRQRPWFSLNGPPKSRILLALCGLVMVFGLGFAAQTTGWNPFDLYREKGAAHALAEVNDSASKRPISDEDVYAKAYFLFELERTHEAETLATSLLSNPSPRIKALANHLLGLISLHRGDKDSAIKLFTKALSSDGLDVNSSGIVSIDLARVTEDLGLVEDTMAIANKDEPGYWKLMTTYARARFDLASTLEEAKSWALLGIDYAQEGQYPKKEAFFRKDLAIVQILLDEPTVQHLKVQEIAIQLQDRRIWFFSLIPEALIAKREENEIRYDWILERLESYSKEDSSDLIKANIKWVKNWSP